MFRFPNASLLLFRVVTGQRRSMRLQVPPPVNASRERHSIPLAAKTTTTTATKVVVATAQFGEASRSTISHLLLVLSSPDISPSTVGTFRRQTHRQCKMDSARKLSDHHDRLIGMMRAGLASEPIAAGQGPSALEPPPPPPPPPPSSLPLRAA